MHYFITGHTGFKGSWLSLWLTQEGHEVSGLALDPEPGSLFSVAGVSDFLKHDIRADIRDSSDVRDALTTARPDVVVHMAAQPLVRDSYRDPRWTFETNVMGTLNILEAVRDTGSVSAQLIVTTDKVYRNVNQEAGYVESDPLGGQDPYSASKAMADILAQSWVSSFAGPPTAIARAGNVIGGGDVSRDRLLPDIMRAFMAGRQPELRYPNAVRPWQHVLDCLAGYRALIDAMIESPGQVRDWGTWNFGPGEANFVSVGEVSNRVAGLLGRPEGWSLTASDLHEAALLALNAAKANQSLGWRDRLSLDAALEWTVAWFVETANGIPALQVTLEQLAAYEQREHNIRT